MQNKSLFYAVLALLLLTSCFRNQPQASEALPEYSERQIDSLSFYSRHHYTNGYNFVVRADSLPLLRQQPEEALSNLEVDTFVVKHDELLVVYDIRILPADSIDSVWVQLARDQETFGWIHESELLPNVMPDDPISQFIETFSDTHLLIFLAIIAIIAIVYWLWKLARKSAYIVHFRDIDSFYPTLLCLLVAVSATLYASIQLFAPDMWRHFYYHPTLNPFSVPPLLAVFLASIWAMLIVLLAVLDDLRHQLPTADAALYLSGLAAVCAANYIVFSLSTLYYVGYLLLIIYIVFALKRYFAHSRARFTCGNCGAKLHKKGRCPHCGTLNN